MILARGLRPIVERELKIDASGLDVHALLKMIGDNWHPTLERVLGRDARSLVGELRTARNRWAHQQPFTLEDVHRTADTAARLLAAAGAREAAELDTERAALLQELAARMAPTPPLPASRPPNLTAPPEGSPTKSSQIQALHAQGLSVAEIARRLGIRYQHAYNVLHQDGSQSRTRAGRR